MHEMKIMGVALLSVEGNFTVFEYDKQRIRFKTSSRLVRYTEIVVIFLLFRRSYNFFHISLRSDLIVSSKVECFV